MLDKSSIVFLFILSQVCDSDTMLDPASSVEMVKVLEEDPMVGGVGGDVQVSWRLLTKFPIFTFNFYLNKNLISQAFLSIPL